MRKAEIAQRAQENRRTPSYNGSSANSLFQAFPPHWATLAEVPCCMCVRSVRSLCHGERGHATLATHQSNPQRRGSFRVSALLFSDSARLHGDPGFGLGFESSTTKAPVSGQRSSREH